MLGPARAAMERKEGRYRAQLLLRSAQRAPLHELLRVAARAARRCRARRAEVRWSLDVDPLEL